MKKPRCTHYQGRCDHLVCDKEIARAREFPVNSAEDMDEQAIEILTRNMRAGRRTS